MVNPDDDVSALRVINTPRRGIGSTSVAKIEAFARDHSMSFLAAAQACVAEEGLGGETHGVCGGVQYVEAVDVGGVDGGHSPCEGVGFYVGAQDVALPFGQLLGVVEDGVGVA